MKTIRKHSLLLLCSFFLITACNQEDLNLKKENLKNYLNKKTKKESPYLFFDETYYQKNKSKLPKKALHFKTIQELDVFLNTLKKSIKNGLRNVKITNKKVTTTLNTSQRFDKRIFTGAVLIDKVLFICETYMRFSFIIDETDCNASDFNSWLSGCTIGLSYGHITGYADRDSSNDREFTYTIIGELDLVIFVEGLGTVYTETIEHKDVYTCPPKILRK